MKPLLLYNTATRNKDEFVSQRDTIGIYCCGPTVYNYAHIGNLRTYIFEDILKRVLLAHDYKVKHVVNITDVGHMTSDADSGDDKMEKGAVREGKTVWQIAEFFTKKFRENIKELNILEPDVWPKATDHIPEMINLIKDLEQKGYTYRTDDGVYFDTARFDRYCEFARLDPDSMRAGERVDMGDKKALTDFALWKISPKDKKRQMEWDSPWGIGFPGWHIECSAMAAKYLEEPIDIHCGGADHIRVHHTNEIAQSEALTGKTFVKFWIHGEFLVLDKEKMSKSGGSFVTLDTVKKEGISPLAYRWFCFTAHYRSPLTFSWDGLKAASQSLVNLRKSVPAATSEVVKDDLVERTMESFYSAISDDLNMPRAVAALWEILKNNTASSSLKRECAIRADKILGINILEPSAQSAEIVECSDGTKVKLESSVEIPVTLKEKIVEKIQNRRQARKDKQFQISDQIRNVLLGKGIIIKDLPDGTAECQISADACLNYELIIKEIDQ
jgi:cysteinyl-tRNA synthetase